MKTFFKKTTTKNTFLTVTSSILVLAVFFSITGAHITHAASAATLTLSDVTTTNSKITAYGDPYSPVELHYGLYASKVTALGSTDKDGYLRTPINTVSYDIACGQTAYVVVNGQRSQSISWTFPNKTTCDTNTTTSANSSISFSPSDIVLSIGQTQAVTLTGNGGYTVSSNSNPVVSAEINGSVLNLRALAFGGTAITVCQNGGQCAILYVVSLSTSNATSNTNSNSTSVTTINTTSEVAPLSFSVSSSNLNGKFTDAGTTLTLTLNSFRSISISSVIVNGAHLGTSVNGNNTSYTSKYTVTGKETFPLSVEMNFIDSLGTAGKALFSIGAGAVVYTPAPTPSATPYPTPSPTPTANNKYTFSKFLTLNSTGEEVTELQKRLTTLGFYSGSITGRFGSLTQTAVKSFQKKHGIEVAGYVGPGTRAKLNQL